MFNLIRMNLYRMVRTKGLWIVMLCMAGFGALTSAMAAADLDVADYYEGEWYEEPDDGFGITVGAPVGADGDALSFLEFYNSNLSSGLLLLFLSIACAIYYSGEIKSGFLKNIAGQTKHKADIFLSKTVVNMLYILLMLLVYGVVLYASFRLMLPKRYTFRFGTEYWQETLLLVLVLYVLHLAFAGGVAFLTTVFKSATVGITVGLLSAFGLPAVFMAYLKRFLDVDFVKLLVSANVNGMRIGVAHKDVIFALGVGIITSIVYYFLGAVYFTKIDVV